MDSHGSTWMVVLAGGSGTRLAPLTTGSDGVVVPKQFCRFGSPISMLEGTLQRARTIVPERRIIAAVVDEHRRWWQTQLDALPLENILVQPRNQGTGAAVLQALATVRDRDPHATLLVVPSDHGIEDEHVLRTTMVTLVNEARNSPGHLVLLGARPTSAEPSYGWIVADPEPVGVSSPVVRFVEKPGASQARELLLEGALWNTFIFACTAHALTSLYSACRPEWLSRLSPGLSPAVEDCIAQPALHDPLPPLDFSRHLLGAATDRLRVLALPRCGWTDLGTPERMRQWMKRRVHRPAEIAHRVRRRRSRIHVKRARRSLAATVPEGGRHEGP